MDRYLAHIREMLLDALRADAAVDPAVFDDTLTREAFVGFVFDNLLSLGLRRADSCELLISVIEKLLY